VFKPVFGVDPARFQGWIVMTLLLNDLAATIVSSEPMTQIDIVDAATSAVIGQNATAGVSGSASAGLRVRHRVDFFGQSWIVYQTRRQALSAFIVGRPTILSFAGFLTAVLVWRLLSARRRAFEVGAKMLDTVGCAIIVLNPDDQIVYASDSIAHVLGYPPEQLLSKRLVDLAENAQSLSEALDRSRNSGTKEMLPRVAFRTETGTARYADVVTRRLVTGRAIVGILITMHDVTEILALERQVEQTARLDSLGRVAAKVAHDFNNILMGIDLHAKLIMKKSTDETVRTSLGHVAKSVERGKEIASAILRFSRPAEVRRQPLDVKKLLRDLEAEIRPLLDPKIHLDVIVPDEEVTVPADAAQIAQVIANVTWNARDAMPAGGPIRWVAEKSAGGRFEFGVVPPGEFLHLQISDRGEGIPRQMIDRIFEPLFTTKQHGTGLGLAISHQIVTKHQGLMFAESNVGAGTNIHVFLPMVAPHYTHATPPTSQ